MRARSAFLGMLRGQRSHHWRVIYRDREKECGSPGAAKVRPMSELEVGPIIAAPPGMVSFGAPFAGRNCPAATIFRWLIEVSLLKCALCKLHRELIKPWIDQVGLLSRCR